MVTTRQIILGDGRALGFAEYGDPKGKPVFYCHGFPASRLEAELTASVAARIGVRVVAADRPGFGRSDFRPDRSITDWPDDLGELADRLGIERFAVLGVSGGGPYALACALRLPARLTRVGLVCGLGPLAATGLLREMGWPARVSFGLARRMPLLLRLLYEGLLGPPLRRYPEAAMKLLTVAAPAADREVLARPEVRRILAASIGEAFRPGMRGATWEMGLYGRPWGFAPEEIAVPVRLWHGTADGTVPFSHGRHLAAALPNCRPVFAEGEGHFTLPIGHMEEILRTLSE
jgi:pimeloyl-ACP methyl ester carboxylesterase